MSQKNELVIPKLRLDVSDSINRPISRSTFLKDKVFAKVVKPLKSRSKSSLGSTASFATDLVTNSRQSYDASRLSQDSDIAPSNTQSSENVEKTIPPALLRPRVTISPVLDTLDHESSGVLWAVVEVSGEVSLSGNPPTPLEVVAILDYSPYSSDDFLRRACQTLVQIAHLLSNDDRLAIIATCQRHPSDDCSCTTGCMLRPLKAPEPTLIENELNSAFDRRGTRPPQDMDLSENLTAAFLILGYSPDRIKPQSTSKVTEDSGSSHDKHKSNCSRSEKTSPLVIIISSNHAELCDIVGPMAPVPVHVIQPGVLPWRSTVDKHDGWKVSASLLQRNSCSLQQELKTLLDHARTTSEQGELRDINIEIEVAATCSIMQTIGMQNHKSLRAGEIISVGVLVSVPPLQSTDGNGDLSLTRPEKIERLICQLESMLGVASQDVLSVKVSCAHSIPTEESYRLIKHETLRLNRYDSQSNWLGHSNVEHARSQELRTALAYKKLMFLAAQSVPIYEACDTLGNIFQESRYHPETEAGMTLVKTEIDFQNMVIKDYSEKNSEQIQDDGIETFSRTNSEPCSQFYHGLGLYALTTGRKVGLQRMIMPSHGSFDCDLESKNENLSAMSHEKMKTTSSDRSVSSDATTIHYELSDEAEDNGVEVEDKARKIWKVMRKNSKSRKQERDETSAALEGIGICDVKLALIRQRALQSKRSIGADTLRSLSFDVDLATRDRPAPWL